MVQIAQVSPCAPNPAENIPGFETSCGLGACPDSGGSATITVQSSATVTLTGNGSSGSPLQAVVVAEPADRYTRVDIGVCIFEELIAGAVAAAYVTPEILRFNAALAESVGRTPNSFSAVINIEQNGATVGTITVASGVITFSMPTTTIFSPGDTLTLRSLDDVTFDYLAVTLVALTPVRYVDNP